MSGYFNKDKEKKIAKEHIIELFNEADNAFKENPKLSDEYVKKARDIQLKFRLKMPNELKRKFCKSCLSYLVPEKTCRVRIIDGKVRYYCYNCKKFQKITLNKRKVVERR